MFKSLHNEASISFNICADSPILIRGANEPGLNPLWPDMRFIRAYRGDEQMPFIPGSSLKGVFRSRAEQIVASIGVAVREPSDRTMDGIMRYKSAKDRYYGSDPVVQLFGQTYLASRVSFQDAFPIKDRPLRLKEHNHVAINRVTGAAQRGSLFNPEALEEGTFAARIDLINYALWQLKLLAYILQDLDEGFLLLGACTTRGYGRVRLEDINVTLREYRKDSPEGKICGYNSDDKVPVQDMSYNKQDFRWTAKREGYEWLLKLPLELADEMQKPETQRGR